MPPTRSTRTKGAVDPRRRPEQRPGDALAGERKCDICGLLFKLAKGGYKKHRKICEAERLAAATLAAQAVMRDYEPDPFLDVDGPDAQPPDPRFLYMMYNRSLDYFNDPKDAELEGEAPVQPGKISFHVLL